MIQELQSSIVEKLKVLFKDAEYKNKEGETKIQVFSQKLPESLYENDPEYCPFILVKVTDGEDAVNSNDDSATNLIFMICIYDNSLDNQGDQDVLSIINDIRLSFLADPNCGGKFRMINKLRWSLDDEDTEPYYFGFVETDWKHSGVKLQSDDLC